MAGMPPPSSLSYIPGTIPHPGAKRGVTLQRTSSSQPALDLGTLVERGDKIVPPFNARPFAAHDDIGNSGVACWEFDHNAWSNDSELVVLSRGKKEFKQAVSDAFEEWGDGARAVVRVKWDRRHGGGGHFFSARREGDKNVYEDPQAGTVRDIDTTLDASIGVKRRRRGLPHPSGSHRPPTFCNGARGL